MLQKTFLQNTSEKGVKNRTAKEASSTIKNLGSRYVPKEDRRGGSRAG